VAFQDARQGTKNSIWIVVNDWNQPLHISERDGLMLMDEITEQKTSPRTARTEVRDDKDIVWEHSQNPSRGHSAKSHRTDSFDIAFQSFNPIHREP
jgi:catalase